MSRKNNRKPQGLTLAKAVDGFHKYKVVEGLSKRTLQSYETHLMLFLERLGDVPLSDITALDVEDFLFWLRTEYQPTHNGYTRDKPLSGKTVYNYFVSLRSFFGWTHKRGFLDRNPMADVPKPKFNEKPIKAFTEEEVAAMLDACRLTKRADTDGRRSFRMERATRYRDEALVLMLLDTGLRASEITSLTIGDVDTSTGEVAVRHGKGDKDRTVFIGKGTRRTLWRYLVERGDSENESAPLFLAQTGNPMNRDSLRLLIRRLGKRAGVKHATPHRFRHTFAISYLRANGDVLTLQALLGHSSLEMVRRYAQVAKIDLMRGHRASSPVDNWNL